VKAGIIQISTEAAATASFLVIASEAKQSISRVDAGLLRRSAPRNDEGL